MSLPVTGFSMLLAGALLVYAVPARAGCTDQPRPGVEWVRCDLNERDYGGVDLSDAVLRDSVFTRSDFSTARLGGIDGRKTKFISARLDETLLDGAVLRGADFTNASLRGASLRHADLREARFFQADLRGADLSGARIDGADLYRADFTGARWIDGDKLCGEGSLGICR